jgi:hypothetical protein
MGSSKNLPLAIKRKVFRTSLINVTYAFQKKANVTFLL